MTNLPPLLAPPDPAHSLAQGPEDWWRRLEPLLSTAADFCTLIDSDYVYRAANDNYCQAHGLGRGEILGRTVADLWGEDLFQDTLRPPLDRCLQGKEVRYRASFGFPRTGPRLYEVSLYPYASGGSDSTHVIAITRDITARRDAEEEVSLVFLLAQAINQAPDFDTALAQVVRVVCRFTGWNLGQAWRSAPGGGVELECAPFCETTHPDLKAFCTVSQERRWGRDEVLPGKAWSTGLPQWVPGFSEDSRHVRGALARELGLTGAMAIPVRAGSEVVAVIEFMLAAPRDEDRRLMGVVSAAAEQLGSLFLRKRAEAALRDSEERYRSVVETANDVIFALTTDGHITALNPAFEALTGWSCADWTGKPFAPLLHPDDLPVALARLQAIVQGEPPHRSEYRVRKADGSYALGEFTVAQLVHDGKITGLSGIGRDVTERKRAEQAVLQSEEHYRELFHEAFKMQEKLRRLSERILQVQEQERARISRDLHDEVGQALTAINVNLAVLGKALAATSPAVARRLTDTRQLLEHTMETVHNFSRELRPAMLDDLGLIPALRSYFKACATRTGLAVDFRPGRDDRIERLDADRKTVLYRVAQEGLNNAVKHALASRVVVEAGESEGRVQLTIRDDGCGFVTNGQSASEAPGRLGLLGIAERVRLVNGEFTIESAPGQGTTLRVVVPFPPA